MRRRDLFLSATGWTSVLAVAAAPATPQGVPKTKRTLVPTSTPTVVPAATSTLAATSTSTRTATATATATPVITQTPSSTPTSAESSTVAVTPTSTNYILTSADDVILATGGPNGITITLPGASTVTKKFYSIKKVDAGVGAITLAGTIDSITNSTLALQYDAMMIVPDNSGWWSF